MVEFILKLLKKIDSKKMAKFFILLNKIKYFEWHIPPSGPHQPPPREGALVRPGHAPE